MRGRNVRRQVLFGKRLERVLVSPPGMQVSLARGFCRPASARLFPFGKSWVSTIGVVRLQELVRQVLKLLTVWQG